MLGKTYWMDAKHVIDYYRRQTSGGRKSIPLAAFEQHGFEIPCSFGTPVDYLNVIDQIFFNES
jgi:recombination protein U